ncbi:MAG TPA: hypothetical protein VGN39_08780 [Terriglobales bacterium]|jgi:hypothetical protein|nr:hypothetical protein [Terriglobales bacterium]
MNAHEYVIPILTAVIGLVGVLVGGIIANWNNKREQRRTMLQQQFSEFYGPLLALRSQIKAKSELRARLSQLVCEEMPRELSGLPPQANGIVESEFRASDRMIDYNNRQIEQDLLPAYKEMRDLFVSKMYLAERATLPYLPELVEFIEIWDRWMDKSLPRTALTGVNHSENRLYPFYDEIEEQFESLRQKLSKS